MKFNSKNLFSLILILFTLVKTQAQQLNPRLIEDPKRTACFLFAEGESPFNTKVKVIIVSTYIYRQKYEDYSASESLGTASKLYYINLINAFNKKLRDIESNERYLHTTATGNVLNGDIILRSSVIEAHLSPSSGLAFGYCPTQNNNQPIVSYRSSTDFSENCRERFIDEKRREGYKVFQVRFDEYYDRSPSGLFTVAEFNAAIDEVRPLSQLYVDYYRAGEIKSLSGYKANESSSSSSSSSKSKSGTNSKTQTTNTTTSKETDEERTARMNMRMTQAYDLERKGDEHYRMGTLFYKQAYDDYKASYQMYPLASVQRKIQNLENMMKVAKAVDKFGNKVDDAVYRLDSQYRTSCTIGFIQYNGFLGTASQSNHLNINKTPSDFWFGITGQRLYLSFQARMGYMQTGNMELRIRRSLRGSTAPAEIVDSVLVNNAGLGLGLSAGINIPIKSFHLYGLYGYEFKQNISGNLISNNFRFEESKDVNDVLPLLQRRIEFGLNGKIPKSRFGIGVNYILLSIKTSKPASSGMKKLNPTSADAAGTNLYYLDSYTQLKYRYSNFGVKLFWMLN